MKNVKKVLLLLLAAALLALAVWFGYKPAPIEIALDSSAPPLKGTDLAFYAALFGLCGLFWRLFWARPGRAWDQSAWRACE